MLLAEEPTAPALTQGNSGKFDIRFPDSQGPLDQDEAWCEVKIDGEWQKFRFHDYDKLYRVPGLYESLFYRTLRCCSPVRVTNLLEDVLRDWREDSSTLRVFDIGAGNGMVAETLHDIGIDHAVGLDIIPEAKTAAERDRPWVYDAYHVANLADLDEDIEKAIREAKLNCLTSVAALGFGDLPDRAFLKALDLVETPAWVAFNIKEDFIDDGDRTGFAKLTERLRKRGILQVQAYHRYCHRLSVAGEPLHYVAMVATKLKDVPADLLE